MSECFDANVIAAHILSKISDCTSYDELYNALDDISETTAEKIEGKKDLVQRLVTNYDKDEISKNLEELAVLQFIAGINLGITLCADKMLEIKHNERK